MKKIVSWVVISLFWASPGFATGAAEKLRKNAQGGYTLTEHDGDKFVAVPDGKGGYVVKGPRGYKAWAKPDGKGGYTSTDNMGFSYKAVEDGKGGFGVIGDNGKTMWVAKVRPMSGGNFTVNSRYQQFGKKRPLPDVPPQDKPGNVTATA